MQRPYCLPVTGSPIIATGAAGLSVVLILLCVVVIPIAATAFARSGRRYDEIGKGRFAVDFDRGEDSARHEEIHQLVQARAYRQEQRGEQPLDVPAEVDRLLAGPGPSSLHPPPVQAKSPGPHGSPGADGDPGRAGSPGADGHPRRAGSPGADRHPGPEGGIRDEIRQVIVARNEGRARRGEEPLDVEAEVNRMLAEHGPEAAQS